MKRNHQTIISTKLDFRGIGYTPSLPESQPKKRKNTKDDSLEIAIMFHRLGGASTEVNERLARYRAKHEEKQETLQERQERFRKQFTKYLAIPQTIED